MQPDVIYGLLNWRAVPLVHAIVDADLGVPVVWHFKEASQRCLVRGTWPLLADLHRHADAVIYSTALERDWFEAALPGARDPTATHVVDGDLPKGDWFDPAPRPDCRTSTPDRHRVARAPGRVRRRLDAPGRQQQPGELTRATWDDLNPPARLSVLAAAGVPVLQQASPGSAVAVANLVAERAIGILYDDVDDLARSCTTRSR